MYNTEKEKLKHIEALKKVQSLAKELRLQDGGLDTEIDYSRPIHYEERVGQLNGKAVKRLIIRLRSTGCEWAQKTGGCTMCGFYSATAHGSRISKEDCLSQIEHVINEVDLNDYPIVGLYCDGNFFNENEMPIDTVKGMFNLLNNFKNIKRVNIESRMEYSSIARVKKVKKLLNGKQLEVSFGFESVNRQVMNLCINKGFPINKFDNFYNVMQSIGIRMKPLILLKPPFLTEQEAINDVLSTIDFLSMQGIKRADLEVMTVAKNTIVHELWKRNLYRPPMLWSIIDLIRRYKNRYNEKFNLYVSPWSYSVEALDWTKNCGRCDEEVIRSINRYNNSFDTDMLRDLTCSCKDTEWKLHMREVNKLTIPERITNQLNSLESTPNTQ